MKLKLKQRTKKYFLNALKLLKMSLNLLTMSSTVAEKPTPKATVIPNYTLF